MGFYGVVTVFAVGYSLFAGGFPTLFGSQSPPTSSLLVAVVVGLGIVGLCHLGLRLFGWVRRAGDALAGLLGPIGYGQAVALALASGFAEELLFRGALWPHLHLLGTTFLFAIVHVLPRKALLGYPLFALAVGLLLGFLRDGSESVVPPMICHAIVNALNLPWLEKRRRALVSPPAAAPA
jgi:membrane protease YdiL (CAAX protease family)